MTALSDITVAVVTHNNSDTIADCIGPLIAHGIPVIVVDSASSDETAAAATKLGAQVIQAENRGFAAGCNTCAREASTELLVFLNPDASMSATDLAHLRDLWRALQAEGHKPVLGPNFQGENSELGDSYRLWFYSSSLVFRKRLLRMKAVVSTSVSGLDVLIPERISGTSFMIDRQSFLDIGGFDERFFLYFEDADLSIRLKSEEFLLAVHPSVEIGHIREHSSKRRSDLNQIRTRSAALMARKHRGRMGLASFVLDATATNLVAAMAFLLRGQTSASRERLARLLGLRDLRGLMDNPTRD